MDHKTHDIIVRVLVPLHAVMALVREARYNAVVVFYYPFYVIQQNILRFP